MFIYIYIYLLKLLKFKQIPNRIVESCEKICEFSLTIKTNKNIKKQTKNKQTNFG